MRLARRFVEARESAEVSRAELSLKLMALLLMLDLVPIWYLRPTLVLLVGLALLYPRLLRTPALWAGIVLLEAVRVIRLWPDTDNHVYLIAYWSLAIFIALCLPDPGKSLAVSARWLLGAMFLWAALWKGVLSPDYRDGRFFTVRLLTDVRFQEKVELLGGQSTEQVLENRRFLEPAAQDDEAKAERPSELRLGPRFSGWVTFLTWSTLLSEAALALAFLLPWGRWTRGLRHGLLLAFCVGTYAFAPVPVFGWLLAAIGVSLVPAERRALRAAYVAVCFLIFFFQDVPWAALVMRIDGMV